LSFQGENNGVSKVKVVSVSPMFDFALNQGGDQGWKDLDQLEGAKQDSQLGFQELHLSLAIER
jgi:hypothetical protein